MFYSVDRIEGSFAVCTDDSGELINIPVSEIADEIHEGSILLDTENGYVSCPDEEESRRKANFSLAESLFD